MSKKLPIALIWLAGLGVLLPAAAGTPPEGENAVQATQRSGTLETRPGRRLRLATELGNVHIRTGKSDQVSYQVQVETDSPGPEADRRLRHFEVAARGDTEGVSITGRVPSRWAGGRVWVNFNVEVPATYNLDVRIGAGNIETDDIHGRVSLSTDGGNITTGHLGGLARLVTQGGHILVRGVAGDLTANTAGGHITVGDVEGDAMLQTGGGHIRVGSVQRTAKLVTGGGNISLEHAGGGVVADTGGGQIELGEASGALRAQTGGGGIRVLRVAGPTILETGGGRIFLTQVQNAVHASTGAGGITAWFNPQGKVEGSSQLKCGAGDIVVYLPRELPITIDAAVEEGGEHRIIVDPAFPLKVTYGDPSQGTRIVRAEGALNGGGEVLHLKTLSGNIRLMLSEAAQKVIQGQMDELRRRLELDRQRLERQMQDLQKRLREMPRNPVPAVPPAPPDGSEN